MPWLEDFRRDTAPIISDPFWLCLAEAIAVVESGHGASVIHGPLPSPPAAPGAQGLNEIGYKALPGHPGIAHATLEAGAGNNLYPCVADFRLFSDRAEQAHALLWLLRSSAYYETARLLFILAFYSAYAPGRLDGAPSLVRVFNELALSGAHPGVAPLLLIENPGAAHPCVPSAVAMDPEARALNHAAARQAVHLFADLTSPTPSPD